jgi:hypothetical protein
MANISIKAVKELAKGIPWSKVIKKVANADRGTRVFPSQTPKNDQKHNFRIDKGSKVGDKHELILQADMNSKGPGIKAEAAKDSHKIWGKILVDPENFDAKKALEDLIASFKENS